MIQCAGCTRRDARNAAAKDDCLPAISIQLGCFRLAMSALGSFGSVAGPLLGCLCGLASRQKRDANMVAINAH
jgi:hypothetical protein